MNLKSFGIGAAIISFCILFTFAIFKAGEERHMLRSRALTIEACVSNKAPIDVNCPSTDSTFADWNNYVYVESSEPTTNNDLEAQNCEYNNYMVDYRGVTHEVCLGDNKENQ